MKSKGCQKYCARDHRLPRSTSENESSSSPESNNNISVLSQTKWQSQKLNTFFYLKTPIKITHSIFNVNKSFSRSLDGKKVTFIDLNVIIHSTFPCALRKCFKGCHYYLFAPLWATTSLELEWKTIILSSKSQYLRLWTIGIRMRDP